MRREGPRSILGREGVTQAQRGPDQSSAVQGCDALVGKGVGVGSSEDSGAAPGVNSPGKFFPKG